MANVMPARARERGGVAERLKAPVLKTYAPGFATLRQVTPLAKSKIFRHRGSAGLRHRSWEWALSGH
jgi:hypothetical protein